MRGLGGGRVPRSEAEDTRRWLGYYRWTRDRPPRELLLRTLRAWRDAHPRARPRSAVDLGCGAGNETLELLRQGWTVLSLDRQAEALRFVGRRVAPRLRPRWSGFAVGFEGLTLPTTDLVHASFSLPFCRPEAFPRLWSEIRSSLPTGGIVGVTLFGDRDAWAPHRRDMTFLERAQVLALLRGFERIGLREIEEDGDSYGGPKHWHYYEVIGRRR